MSVFFDDYATDSYNDNQSTATHSDNSQQ